LKRATGPTDFDDIVTGTPYEVNEQFFAVVGMAANHNHDAVLPASSFTSTRTDHQPTADSGGRQPEWVDASDSTAHDDPTCDGCLWLRFEVVAVSRWVEQRI
jgi:hypothetical protein